jgi:hypothetical protein
MMVLFDEIDYSFAFYSFGQTADTDTEVVMLKRDLSNIMMSDERFEHFDARLDVVSETLVFEKATEPHRLRHTNGIGQSVVLRFHQPQGAMVFKLAYIQGDQFIPWIHPR